MQKIIFRNMDGMTYSNFLDVFEELKHKEKLMKYDFCLESYRWVLGEWVYHRIRDALVKRYGLDMAEQTIKYGKIVGIVFNVSIDICPNAILLEREEPKMVYISTGGRGYGKSFMADLMKHAYRGDFPDSMRYLGGFLHSKEDNMNYRIKDVIFSGPCTIVLWKDGTKTIVRCENEFFDREKGLAMAICKKVLGTNNSGSNYYDIFKKWCSEEGVTYNPSDDIPEFLNKKFNVPKEDDMRNTMSNLITDMKLRGATSDEIDRAIKHSKVVLDCEKSARDNGIDELMKKYQSQDDFDGYMNLPEEPVIFTIEQVANKTGLSKTTINRRCLYKDYPNAKKIDGVWWIPEADFQKDIKEGK